MSGRPQSFEHHAKIVPAYHYGMLVTILLPTLYFLFLAVTDFSLERLAMALFAMGLVLTTFYARAFPLGVQDRVIRLEERLRLERLLPDDLEGRARELETEQLIGLRFASDEELPDLVRRVLDEGIGDRKSIKQAVRNWKADEQRI